MYEGSLDEPLRAPALLVAFDGWVSAGAAGTTTLDHIAGDAEPTILFDSDRLYDYRVNRPTLDFVDGIMRHLVWPGAAIRIVRTDERDLLLLSGAEPNWGWKAFADSVAGIAVEAGVVQQVSLGGIPWAAPHTRPTVVVTTASRPDLVSHGPNFPDGLLRVPASAASVVESAVAERGIPTVGFWARVPHYVGGVYYPAVLDLVERVSRHLGIDIPLRGLTDEAAEQRRSLDDALEEQPAVRQIVSQLEDLYDAAGEVASGEEIAAEIERFLRDRPWAPSVISMKSEALMMPSTPS
jgi:predicted ATP-grasp superfamily ATP-dependent carboligase